MLTQRTESIISCLQHKRNVMFNKKRNVTEQEHGIWIQVHIANKIMNFVKKRTGRIKKL